jgi:hypothetical protein
MGTRVRTRIHRRELDVLVVSLTAANPCVFRYVLTRVIDDFSDHQGGKRSEGKHVVIPRLVLTSIDRRSINAEVPT